MRYSLTHRATQTVDGAETVLSPHHAYLPGDPEDAWMRRIERLREQRMRRSPEDLQSIETGHADGTWWIEFSDSFTAWSIADEHHVQFTTATRLEYEEVTE